METTEQKKLTKEEIIRKYQPESHGSPYYHECSIESMMDEWAKVSGIHWFEIAKGELPPVGNDPFHKANNWSDMVLISNAKKGVIGFGLCTLESGRFSNNNGNWQPTHWAIINFPQSQTP